MSYSSRQYYYDREILKELRLRVETNDPLYFGQKKLKMRGKDLQSLPSVLFTMMDLEVLDLSPARESCLNFRLPLVPPSIGKLINLRVLMIDTNELYTIPKEICMLYSLERLSLSNNSLTSIPHGFGRLNNLRSVHLANNKFDAFPVEVCDLISLEFLDLSDNLLVSLPDDILRIETLTTLLLNYNKLMKLPDVICKMNLDCLWLGNNRLRELPRRFGDLNRLDWGYRYTSSFLENNPLMHPPLEICRMGPTNIEAYFVDLEQVREISTPEFEKEEIDINDKESTADEVTVTDDAETDTKNNDIESIHSKETVSVDDEENYSEL